MRSFVLFLTMLVGVPIASIETEYPYWDSQESIEEYAKKIGLPTTKTLDLGNGVMMEFVLIPAGEFMMGTSEPEPVDELLLTTHIWAGLIVLILSTGTVAVLLGFAVFRGIREKRRPQVSLARAVILFLAASVAVLGGSHWHTSEMAMTRACAEYDAAWARYMGAALDEKPAHKRTFPVPFYMGRYEVTQAQYKEVVGQNPSCWIYGPDFPVECVSWREAKKFCEMSSRITEQRIRLPSEAEWEYACRAGTQTDYHTGDGDDALALAGWCVLNSEGGTCAVGRKTPNNWGLYDMHGNVWEWCEDLYAAYPSGFVEDVQKIQNTLGPHRVLRGGAYIAMPHSWRAAKRKSEGPGTCGNTIGFRVVMDSPEESGANRE